MTRRVIMPVRDIQALLSDDAMAAIKGGLDLRSRLAQLVLCGRLSTEDIGRIAGMTIEQVKRHRQRLCHYLGIPPYSLLTRGGSGGSRPTGADYRLWLPEPRDETEWRLFEQWLDDAAELGMPSLADAVPPDHRACAYIDSQTSLTLSQQNAEMRRVMGWDRRAAARAQRDAEASSRQRTTRSLAMAQ